MSVSTEQILRTALLADPGVADLLGDSLYLDQLPQNPNYPAATYQRISTVPLLTQDQGARWGSCGWARFQITVWCQGQSSGSQRDQIARAIQAAMLAVNCHALPTSPELQTQAPNYLLNWRSGVEPQTDPPLFKCILDYRIAYQDQ